MSINEYNLRVLTASNGWIIYLHDPNAYSAPSVPRAAWVCGNDESLAELIAAALVSAKLEDANRPESQEKVKAAAPASATAATMQMYKNAAARLTADQIHQISPGNIVRSTSSDSLIDMLKKYE